tara:strand:- start:1 stop:495 length:495 start_codon:yes stop_codon:yes gene_type:complete
MYHRRPGALHVGIFQRRPSYSQTHHALHPISLLLVLFCWEYVGNDVVQANFLAPLFERKARAFPNLGPAHETIFYIHLRLLPRHWFPAHRKTFFQRRKLEARPLPTTLTRVQCFNGHLLFSPILLVSATPLFGLRPHFTGKSIQMSTKSTNALPISTTAAVVVH